MSAAAKKESGQHPAVRAFREKLDSIGDHQVPALEALNRRVAKLKERATSTRPPADPRREEDDDDIPGVEIVDLSGLDAKPGE